MGQWEEQEATNGDDQSDNAIIFIVTMQCLLN